jgi:hypothetical protein
MGVITTGNNPKLLWPGLAAIWGRDYPEWKKQYDKLFDMESSTQAYEEDVEVTGYGLAPVKAQGGATTYDSDTQGTVTRYTHVAYSLGFIVTKEEIDDNLYVAKAKPRVQALAFSMNQTKENVAANVYNRAFSSTYAGGDGVAMISASHPDANGNTQSNILSVAANISEQAIEDMVIQIKNATNSKGLNIPLRPKSLHISNSDIFETKRILGSQLQNDTANNALNALNEMNMIPAVYPNTYFTSSSAWFIRTDAPRGLVGFQRVAAEFTRDNDFDTENDKSKCYERYTFRHTDWRGIYGSEGV